MNNSYFL